MAWAGLPLGPSRTKAPSYVKPPDCASSRQPCAWAGDAVQVRVTRRAALVLPGQLVQQARRAVNPSSVAEKSRVGEASGEPQPEAVPRHAVYRHWQEPCQRVVEPGDAGAPRRGQPTS